MKTVYHQAASRGRADHGWLNSAHTFSFAQYYDPQRMGFGALRVLNDDCVAGGAGFGMHPHQDMEIISLPLAGALAHRDSMGHSGVIRAGEVQVMSAGTGIAHSEMNADTCQAVQFLQIWVRPRQLGVTPRYQQADWTALDEQDDFKLIVSPEGGNGCVWIHQDAWFSLADWRAGRQGRYTLKQAGNGVYVFVISGSAVVGGMALNPRDGLGLWDTDSFDVAACGDARLLLMEVPMIQAA